MSTIKLYHSTPATSGRWKLLASRLFKIENIEAYLATISSSFVTTIENFQYIKTELEISIKLDMNQVNAEVQTASSIQYVSVQNDTNGRRAYYFVKRRVSLSQKCIRLDLILDVLNTYTDGTDYIFKKNTRIVREHKNRFVKKSLGTLYRCDGTIDNYYFEPHVGDILYVNLQPDGTADAVVRVIDFSLPSEWFLFELRSGSLTAGRMNLYDNERYEDADEIEFYALHVNTEPASEEVFRNIDYINENINPILQCGSATGNKVQDDKSPLVQDWYLLYRNTDNPDPANLVNPVECYLIPELSTKVNSGTITDGRIRPEFIEEGKMYCFAVLSGNPVTLSNGVTWSHKVGSYRRIFITKAGGKLNCFLASGDSGLSVVESCYLYDDIDYASFSSLPVPYNIYNDTEIDYDRIAEQDFDYSFNNTGDYNVIDNIDLVDRVDPKNIKLIKIPYCPYDFNVSGDTLQTKTDSNWEYTSVSQSVGGPIRCLRLKSLNTKLNRTILTDKQPLPYFYLSSLSDLDPDITDLRYSIGNLPDSKLYHSEFYKPTYVYDSFTYSVQLEKINTSNFNVEEDVNTFYIRFDMTRTINSKFMFTFASLPLKNAESNFAHVLPIARNNEEVLYNSSYVSYIKSGYNYDVKNKNMQVESNVLSVGLNAGALMASLAMPSAPLKVAGVVGSLVSMAMSIKSAVTSAVQSENAIHQRLNQTANQSASVAGSDDVDLMSVYAENRLKYYVYQPSEVVRNYINDLFFYAGYNSGRMGVPTHNNRVNFDYLECDAVLESVSANMSEEIIAELVNAFKNGVTYIHQTERATDKWDIEQKYENWEVDLLED